MNLTSETCKASGGPKGLPWIGMLFPAIADPLKLTAENAINYGDVIPYKLMGWDILQLNHPDPIRQVLITNHKNYVKSEAYIRFESVLGQGLLTSNGEKWRRDRQKIQPMFRREQMEGYYFDVTSEVAERYKKRWFELTERGPAEINITQETASFTLEVIVKLIFGKDNLSREDISELYHMAEIFLEYLKNVRIFPRIDLHQLFHTPRYHAFKRQRDKFYALIDRLIAQNRQGMLSDQFNMLALLIEAQRQDPGQFNEQDIRDQCATMIFAGFETTSVLIQWIWFCMDAHPQAESTLREEIAAKAPACLQQDSMGLTHEALSQLTYLEMVFKETMRLYPSFWVISRQPLEEDILGGVTVGKRSVIVLPQIVMHRHPRFWEQPNAFMPERFSAEKEALIDDGIYFPFSHGARKCSGYKLAELEAKMFMAKLLPHFKLTLLNGLTNGLDPGISLQPKAPLRVQINRI